MGTATKGAAPGPAGARLGPGSGAAAAPRRGRGGGVGVRREGVEGGRGGVEEAEVRVRALGGALRLQIRGLVSDDDYRAATAAAEKLRGEVPAREAKLALAEASLAWAGLRRAAS